MKKKRISIILAIMIIFAAMILVVTQRESTLIQPDLPPAEEEKESALEEQVNMEEEAEAEEEEDEQRSFPQMIAEAVQSTVDFFTNQETHIVAIGDSLTQGVGDETEQNGYVGILDRTINGQEQIARIDNYGKRGNRTDHLLMRLEDEEISQAIRESDIVLITIGANDIMQVAKENFTNLIMDDFVFEMENYEERLREIFNEIRQLNPDTEIYLLGFYNPFKNYFEDIEELDVIVETWNTTGKEVVNEFENTMFIPTEDLFNDPDADLFADDNFHPNYDGYYLIAERVLEYITIR
ncbi:SGNH/GDSL hydrolase family protein [Oceanobacillus saliphilus]|uniref:SGNH/GDSL hydrolase family protein n=1 Tax=Oceanobacillus saliphilus TaxID=2925834 RepID=UPI00201D715E|nr:SGNH/GDSL hydrolase family protein [Oceanobacillus saliphilus]